LLEIEIVQLKRQLDISPEEVLAKAQQCLIRSKQMHYPEGTIQCFIMMSRCTLHLGKHSLSVRYAKEALAAQNNLDNDRFLPEILHLHAMNFWEDGKCYTAQQYWINALEQSALEEEIEILIECLMGLGNIWRATGASQQACETHELAVKVANNTRIEWLEGRARILWAWDLYLQGNYGEMLTVLDVAMELLESYQNKQWVAEIWDFRALALLGLERLTDAEEATQKAHDLAVVHHLDRVKVHSYISRIRLELMRQNIDKASTLLTQAEQLILDVENDELLAQIYYHQSVIAEQKHQFKQALKAFKKFKKHSLNQLKRQITQESRDRVKSSKKQLEQRARKLINRVRNQYEFDPENHLSNVVSETHWWEQIVLSKTALTCSNHSVIIIYHQNPLYIDICTELAHSLCSKPDLIARLSMDRLGFLLEDTGDIAQNVFYALKQMVDIYPWQRQGLTGPLPSVVFHNILSFPLTLEQLIQLPIQEQNDARFTQ
jgi:tetratricopeptide (TPR) repeat protein